MVAVVNSSRAARSSVGVTIHAAYPFGRPRGASCDRFGGNSCHVEQRAPAAGCRSCTEHLDSVLVGDLRRNSGEDADALADLLADDEPERSRRGKLNCNG